jgi:hypothetical protein
MRNRVVNFIETESRIIFIRDWMSKAGNNRLLFIGYRLPFRVDKKNSGC